MRFDGLKGRRSAELTIFHNGLEETFWRADKVTFEDARGNVGDFLCKKEAAWKWSAVVHRTEHAPFRAEELVSITNASLPPPTRLVSFPVHSPIGGRTVTNISVAGPGQYEWSNGVLMASSAVLRPANSYGASYSSSYTKVWRHSLNPFVILSDLPLAQDTRLIIRARGADGEIHAATFAGSTYGASFYDLPQHLTPGPFKFDIVVDSGYRFEVKVAPPD